MHDCKGKSRQFFALNFSIKGKNKYQQVLFNGQQEMYNYIKNYYVSLIEKANATKSL